MLYDSLTHSIKKSETSPTVRIASHRIIASHSLASNFFVMDARSLFLLQKKGGVERQTSFSTYLYIYIYIYWVILYSTISPWKPLILCSKNNSPLFRRRRCKRACWYICIYIYLDCTVRISYCSFIITTILYVRYLVTFTNYSAVAFVAVAVAVPPRAYPSLESHVDSMDRA